MRSPLGKGLRQQGALEGLHGYPLLLKPAGHPTPGARVQLLNPPGSEAGPGQVCTWGKATANQVDAHRFQWNWAGKSSKHIPFDWTGPA